MATNPFEEFGGSALAQPEASFDPFAEFGGRTLPAAPVQKPQVNPFAEFGGTAISPAVQPKQKTLYESLQEEKDSLEQVKEKN